MDSAGLEQGKNFEMTNPRQSVGIRLSYRLFTGISRDAWSHGIDLGPRKEWNVLANDL